jgi:uncharacterized protein
MGRSSRYYPTFSIGQPNGGFGVGNQGDAGTSHGPERVNREPALVDSRTGQGRAPRVRAHADGRFDAFGLAKRGAVIEGRVDAQELPRVNDQLVDDGSVAEVRYRIAGSADGAGRPALEVSLSAVLPLICQRCLQSFPWPVEQRTLLLLARDERELARLDQEDHDHEVIQADNPLDPVTLVEDELLLTLPYVPRCPEARCRAAHETGGGANDGE